MTGKLTITAKIGPAIGVTAAVLNDITKMNMDMLKGVLEVTNAGKIIEYDIQGSTTFTATISATAVAIVIS